VLQRWLDHELAVMVNVHEVRYEYEKQSEVYVTTNIRNITCEISFGARFLGNLLFIQAGCTCRGASGSKTS
jgi:hypothetical protein